MSKIKIKVISIGHLPIEFDHKKIENWESDLFDIIDKVNNHSLNCNSDIDSWAFSDNQIREQLPKYEADFLFVILNVPLEDNWYSRRIGNDIVIFTYHEVKDILESHHIPIENIIYRLLYEYSLVYLACNKTIPEIRELIQFTHDETKGCLFDMNGIKNDLVKSCHNPSLCISCQEHMSKLKVSNDDLLLVQKEIINIRKDLYYRIVDFIKKRPIVAIVISSIFALLLGIIGSIIGSIIYDGINNGKILQSNNRFTKLSISEEYQRDMHGLTMEIFIMKYNAPKNQDNNSKDLIS